MPFTAALSMHLQLSTRHTWGDNKLNLEHRPVRWLHQNILSSAHIHKYTHTYLLEA